MQQKRRSICRLIAGDKRWSQEERQHIRQHFQLYPSEGRCIIRDQSDNLSRVESGRVGSGRVGSGRVGSGRVGSGRVAECM
jgi:hypothetical protein